MTQKIYHIVYLTLNMVNGYIYVGKHSSRKLHDSYLGSGRCLNKDIKRFGKENFMRFNLEIFESEEKAFIYEKYIVDYEFLSMKEVYNKVRGGHFGIFNMCQHVVAMDNDGNKTMVSKEVFDVRSDLVGHTKNKVGVVDKEGNTFNVFKDDERIKTGELIILSSFKKGTVAAKDKHGNIIQVSKNDPLLLSGELTGVAKGTVTVRDKCNNKCFRVSVDDPRYISGELVHVSVGRVNVKDNNGNVFNISVDDPRYISGELVHVNSGSARSKESIEKCRSTREKNKQKYFSVWLFVDPCGEEYNVVGYLYRELRDFCKKFNLSFYSILDVLYNKKDNHRGWVCKKLSS